MFVAIYREGEIPKGAIFLGSSSPREGNIVWKFAPLPQGNEFLRGAGEFTRHQSRVNVVVLLSLKTVINSYSLPCAPSMQTSVGQNLKLYRHSNERQVSP
jgi:hypothetical protein